MQKVAMSPNTRHHVNWLFSSQNLEMLPLHSTCKKICFRQKFCIYDTKFLAQTEFELVVRKVWHLLLCDTYKHETRDIG
jgi:hypothetical protein